jgi:transcriptional regulator NrdR family protein
MIPRNLNTTGCPNCGYARCGVTNSRPWSGDYFRLQWRKRKCHKCGHIAQTVEIPVELLALVVSMRGANKPESRKNR